MHGQQNIKIRQDDIPRRKVTGAHAQDIVLNDDLIQAILSAFTQCTRSLHAT